MIPDSRKLRMKKKRIKDGLNDNTIIQTEKNRERKHQKNLNEK